FVVIGGTHSFLKQLAFAAEKRVEIRGNARDFVRGNGEQSRYRKRIEVGAEDPKRILGYKTPKARRLPLDVRARRNFGDAVGPDLIERRAVMKDHFDASI